MRPIWRVRWRRPTWVLLMLLPPLPLMRIEEATRQTEKMLLLQELQTSCHCRHLQLMLLPLPLMRIEEATRQTEKLQLQELQTSCHCRHLQLMLRLLPLMRIEEATTQTEKLLLQEKLQIPTSCCRRRHLQRLQRVRVQTVATLPGSLGQNKCLQPSQRHQSRSRIWSTRHTNFDGERN